MMSRDRAPQRWPLGVAGAVLAAFLLVPLALLAPVAWSPELRATLADATARGALATSFLSATIATAIMALLGVPLGYTLARWRFRGRAALSVALLVPLVFPPVVSGILLISLFGPYGLVGSVFAGHGFELDNSLAGVVIAQTFVASPFVVFSARAAFGAVDPTLDEVAATLGAGPLGIFWRVALPQARAGILAGVALAWLRALGEYGATVIVAYHPYTLPVYTFVQLSAGGVASALPLALVALVVSAGVVALAALVERQTAWATRSHPQAPSLSEIERDWLHPSSPAPSEMERGGTLAQPATLSADLVTRAGDFTLIAAFEAPPGVTVVLGPSGAGKTLLLRSLASLAPIAGGGARLGDAPLCAAPGQPQPDHPPAIGYVPQGYGLFGHMTVASNVAFGLRRLAPGERDERVRSSLGALRVADLASRLPGAISGGQAQRVALARALAIRPRALLLDEPLSAIDQPLRATLRRELRELWRAWGIPIVLVTHDLADARALADHLLLLDEGRVLRAGPQGDVIARPGSARAAALLGQRNLIAARVVERSGNTLALAAGELPIRALAGESRATTGDEVTIALRPGALRLADESRPGWHAAMLSHVEPGDGCDLAHVALGGVTVTVALVIPMPLAPGAPVWLDIPPEAVSIVA